MTKPVFPFTAPYEYSKGIDTRDYIALVVLQGICANPASVATYEQAATMAYGYADALIKESKKNEWHYPSKGELPKEDTAEKETLYLLWFGLNDSDYLTGVFSHGRFWCFDSGWFETNEVVAWKLFEPPSEPMRSFSKEEQKKYTEAISKVYKPTGAKLFDKESE